MVPPEEAEKTEDLPLHVIEHARSGRSKCKTCRRTIEKDALRLGLLVEGPFGVGHMWHHLSCAAKRMLDKVEEAYAAEAWTQAKSPPDPGELPELEDLRALAKKAEAAREIESKDRKTIPFAEIAPSNRSRCKQSGEPIPLGAVRIVLGKEASFGNQTRTSPFAVLPQHVRDALEDPEIGPSGEGLIEKLRSNSDIDAGALDGAIAAIGELG